MHEDLSILCVTRVAEYGRQFRKDMAEFAETIHAEMVFAVDGTQAFYRLAEEYHICKAVIVDSLGYMESVLDESIASCSRKYILRLDDDERISPSMREWLLAGAYQEGDHWSFPRFHIWPNMTHFLASQPYFPDWQTRLSVKEKSGGRSKIHSGSPFGLGKPAKVGIEHYELTVKTLEERATLAQQYARVQGYDISDEDALKTQPERWTDKALLLYVYNGGAIKLS